MSLVVKRSESADAGTFFIRPSLSCCSHLCSSSNSKIDRGEEGEEEGEEGRLVARAMSLETLSCWRLRPLVRCDGCVEGKFSFVELRANE